MSPLQASELGGVHIGRVIRARTSSGAVVEDEAIGVVHGGATTLVRFRHVMPVSGGMTSVFGGDAFPLAHDEQVEVIDA